ncbi:ABC transporter permease [Brachybacterium avium]|uniref:ABC transporter permease n=1 Tax=Brachybacterium avium TaxID=2017485 RepID=UPI0012FE028C|nr:ABC transporter permease [Brachybacterium avium]
MAEEAKATATLVQALRDRGLDPSGLTPTGVRPSLAEYLGAIWERRHFIWMDAGHRVATSNSRNLLGRFWLVLRPMLEAAMYYVIFAVILGVDRGMENFPAFIIIGVLMFRSTMRAITSSPGLLSSNRAMIRAFVFPRAALAVSAQLRESMQMVYTTITVVVMIVVVPYHEFPEFTWLLVPVIFAFQFFLNLGISLVLARIGFIFPDTSNFMALTGRLFMYGSGVIFPIDRFVENNPLIATLIQANPIYHMLAMYREVLMDGTVPALEHWMILGAWAIGLTLFGLLFFWQGEETYGAEQR